MRRLTRIVAFAGAAASVAGQTTFTATTIDPSNSGDCKALADIDGQGRADPILGGSSLSWYESAAGFAKHIIRASPIFDQFTTDMQAVDMDGDGDIDLVIADSGPNNTGTIVWFENPRINPPAGLTADPRIGSNWVYHVIGIQGAVVHDIEVADLDNDGKIDIVTSGHGVTHVWKQVNGTTWLIKDLSSLAGAGVFLGDIDRDGYRDIATPLGWIRNPHDIINGAWVFYPINQAITGDECLLGDFNGDGRLDLMTCDAHNRAAVYWFEAPADPTSPTWTRRLIDPSMGSHHPEAVDFNRDGRTDILMGLELQDLSVYFNNGDTPPTFTKLQLDTQCGHNARSGDINGDGLPDVFGCDYIGNPPAKVYFNHTTVAACYANCDGSIVAPILNINDCVCFLNHFRAGDAYANCDGSTTPPVLNALDFACFINRFAAECP